MVCSSLYFLIFSLTYLFIFLSFHSFLLFLILFFFITKNLMSWLFRFSPLSVEAVGSYLAGKNHILQDEERKELQISKSVSLRNICGLLKELKLFIL